MSRADSPELRQQVAKVKTAVLDRWVLQCRREIPSDPYSLPPAFRTTCDSLPAGYASCYRWHEHDGTCRAASIA